MCAWRGEEEERENGREEEKVEPSQEENKNGDSFETSSPDQDIHVYSYAGLWLPDYSRTFLVRTFILT